MDSEPSPSWPCGSAKAWETGVSSMLRRGFLWRVGELGLSERVTGTLGQGVVSGEGGASKDM